jgi:hypothetical protein
MRFDTANTWDFSGFQPRKWKSINDLYFWWLTEGFFPTRSTASTNETLSDLILKNRKILGSLKAVAFLPQGNLT